MARDAGAILLRYFGRATGIRHKENLTSVVCDADLAADRAIVRQIRREFPDDGIIAEESGHRRGSSGRTWVIDPLDGTSNFVADIPWFGVQIGVLQEQTPVAAVIYRPTEDRVYYAEPGYGLRCNGRKLRVTSETRLKNTLCAFGLDGTADERRSRRMTELLRRVSRGVRNIRATNSLVDFCLTCEGRLGGCINLNTRIWDIVPVSLMLPEAGGKFTGLTGRPIVFDLGNQACSRTYEVVGASQALHPQLVRLLRAHA